MDQQTSVFNETRHKVAGIDIAGHADHYVCGPRRDDGSHDIAHFGTTTSELRRMLVWLQDRQVESVAVESTSVYWIPVADLLESSGIEVVLVDTREVRMVPGRKSDVKDCQWLQKLHSCGLLHGGFRPPESITAVRTLLREKENLTAARTQWIQQMQKSCDQMNIRIHHAVSDIDGKTGLAIIEAIISGRRDPVELAKLRDKRCKKNEAQIAEELTGVWREEHLFNLERAYRMLAFTDEQIALYDAKITEMYEKLADGLKRQIPPPQPEEKKLSAKKTVNAEGKRALLQITGFDMTAIAGIGYDTAAILVSELGTDFSRFPNERHFAAYIGLAPSLGKSAGKNVRQRKRCKNTSRAGRALRMAASTLYRSQSELGAFFRNVARRSDRKTAVKATARRMSHMIYRGVRYGVEYIDKGAETFEKRLREKAVRTVKFLIKSQNIKGMELAAVLGAN
ncbi:MAG: IS110 family transposase [bacterium]|jgi:transposase